MTTTATAVLPFRPFHTTVESVHQLSPSLRRIRFVGPDLHDFGDPGLDQRIKLLLPRPGDAGELAAAMEGDGWYAAWLALPEPDRPPMRTYTTRRVSRAAGDRCGRAVLEVDMVLHEDPGPAGDWARRAEAGHELVVVGPDARYAGDAGGRAFAPPPGSTEVVLVADETALPAVARILEDLARAAVPGAPEMRMVALVEVPRSGDELSLLTPPGAELTWLARDGAPHGQRLDAAVRHWADSRVAEHPPGSLPRPTAQSQAAGHADAEDVLWEVPGEHGAANETPVPARDPGGVLPGTYLWIAAESGTVKSIRRHLVHDLGVDRAWVAFMGYWKRGAPQV